MRAVPGRGHCSPTADSQRGGTARMRAPTHHDFVVPAALDRDWREVARQRALGLPSGRQAWPAAAGSSTARDWARRQLIFVPFVFMEGDR